MNAHIGYCTKDIETESETEFSGTWIKPELIEVGTVDAVEGKYSYLNEATPFGPS